jgi:hypothetical protein
VSAPGDRTRSFSDWYAQKKKDAVEIVANEYDQSPATVESWEKRGLKEQFGSTYVEFAKQRSRRIGERVYQLQCILHKDRLDEKFIEIHLEYYGKPGLLRNAEKHKRALKERKNGRVNLRIARVEK